MSESIQIQMVNNKAATVYVSRKVSVKQFEPLEVGLHLPVELPERGAEDTDVSYAVAVGEALRNGVNVAKVQVYDALGLEYTDNNGIIAERVAAKIPGSSVAPTPRPQTAAPAAPAAPAGETASTNGAPGGAGVVCPKCNGAMWDNRVGKKNPKQPDFKCKDRDRCDGVIWPPKGAK